MSEEPNETAAHQLAEAASRRSSGIAQAGDAGASGGDTPSSGSSPTPVEEGTAAGNPVAGVEISQADAARAVVPDDES